MAWDIDFISEGDFKRHVANTVGQYGDKLVPFDVERFNKNTIDPIKMVFDKAVYGETWEGIISSEIFRQRDKTNSNDIGYFHQRIFDYIDGCHVPPNGKEGGWDVIVDFPDGFEIDAGNTVHRVYVEMKNKHNTMNSASSQKTYMKAQNALLRDDDAACFLVEAIAKRSQNIVWETTVDGQRCSHKRIRRVSIDKFYEIVTGEYDAFLQICFALPRVVQEVLAESSALNAPQDTVYEELHNRANRYSNIASSEEMDMAMMLSMYMLGFATYNGFEGRFGAAV
jgi:hypothetical protein